MYHNRARYLRKQQKLTIVDICNKTGIAPSTLTAFENETRQAQQNLLITLADYYNVSIDYLLGRTDYNTLNKNESDEFRRKELIDKITKSIKITQSNVILEYIERILEDGSSEI